MLDDVVDVASRNPMRDAAVRSAFFGPSRGVARLLCQHTFVLWIIDGGTRQTWKSVATALTVVTNTG